MTTIIYNENNTKQLQQQTKDWLGYMSFSHYLVIDLPLNRKHYDFKKATKYLKTIVKRFEKELIGRHWNKHPVHFLGIAESGDYHIWHWNLLLEASKYTNTNIFNPIASLLSEGRGNGRPVDRVAPVFTDYFNSKTQKLPDGSTVNMVLSPYTLTIDGDGGTIGAVILGLGGMVNAWVGYDNTGRLRIEPSQDDIIDAQKAVLYTFTPEEVTLLGMSYTIKKEDLFNDYIVVGEQMDDYSQPGGRAENFDPRSDTNINIIGRKTKRESASGYATVTQCKDLAEWRLKRSGVLQKAVNFSCSQMFHIELNSLVEIVRTDKPGAPTERHLIQGYSRPLATSGAMTITAVSVNDFPIATVSEWPPAT